MQYKRLDEILDYVQPTDYIVNSTNYNDKYETPVLTAGKSFILGHTNEKDGIYPASKETPVLLFDDFTTEVKYVDFPFKVKSSALKILTGTKSNIKYAYHAMKNIQFNSATHKRYWISEYSKKSIRVCDEDEKVQIIKVLDSIQEEIDKIEKNNTYLKELYNSSFLSFFGEPDQNSHNYDIATLDDVCSSIVRGPFGSSLKKEFFVPESKDAYKVYEQKNAIQKNEKIGNYFVNQEKYNELKRFECVPGDIIMSCSGTIGELFILPKGSKKGIINQALCKFSLKDSVTPNYFISYFNMSIDKLDTKGSSIKNIAAVSYIKNMKILVPPINVQKKYEDIVKNITEIIKINYKKIEKLEELYNLKINEYFVGNN